MKKYEQNTYERRKHMMKDYMVGAEEVAKELGVSKGYAYKLIKKLNDELKSQGYIVISGRLPRSYMETKLYGFGNMKTMEPA